MPRRRGDRHHGGRKGSVMAAKPTPARSALMLIATTALSLAIFERRMWWMAILPTIPP